MAFFFTMPISRNDADQRHDAEFRPKEHQRQDGPTPAEGSVERMVIGWT